MTGNAFDAVKTRLKTLHYNIFSLREKFAAFRERKTADKLNGFLYSCFFPFAVAAVTFVLNSLRVDTVTYLFLALVGCVALIFGHDLMPAFVIGMFYTVARSLGNRDYERFGTASFVILGIALGLVGVCFAFHMLMNFSFGRLRGSKLTWGLVAVCCGLAVNGFFYSGYTFLNLADAFKHTFYLAGIYLLLRGSVKMSKDTLRYFAVACVAHGMVVGMQVCMIYIVDNPFLAGGFEKADMNFGWGISNTAGETLFRDMPMCFYLMCTEKKHNWYYFAAAGCLMLGILATSARASLLFALPAFLACYVLCLVYGKNRRQTLVCGAVVSVVGVFALVFMRDKIFGLLRYFVDKGFGDSGRFRLWNRGISYFLENPVFGRGLRDEFRQYFHNYTYYHNTLIQYTVAGGTVGIATYLYYRMKTYALFTQKPTRDRLFIGVLFAGILCISLLDNFVMYMATQLYLNFAIAFAERDLEKTLPFAYGRRSKAGRYVLLY